MKKKFLVMMKIIMVVMIIMMMNSDLDGDDDDNVSSGVFNSSKGNQYNDYMNGMYANDPHSDEYNYIQWKSV